MSIFVILGLLVCIEAQGPSAVTTVFVKKGDDLILNVDADADVPEDHMIVDWTFNKNLMVEFVRGGERAVLNDFIGRIEFPVKKFSLKLKNLQEADSGVYNATVVTMQGQTQPRAEYKVTVQALAASSAGSSVYLVKIVVFSVGLIIMVSAVITVHLMEKFKKHK